MWCILNIPFNLFQSIENLIDIKEDTEEPQLIQIRVNGEMTREEIVEEILKNVQSKYPAEEETEQVKLLDGYYKPKDSFMEHWKVDGDKIECQDPYNTYDFKASFEYGDFGKITVKFKKLYRFSSSGEADEPIVEKIGKCRFNMVLKYYFAIGNVDEKGEVQV